MRSWQDSGVEENDPVELKTEEKVVDEKKKIWETERALSVVRSWVGHDRGALADLLLFERSRLYSALSLVYG